MSKKNITERVKKDNNTVHVTFENEDGHRVYEYRGSAARSIMRGKDPASLTGGRLVDFKPKEQS
jgi:hypothetical protein